MEEIVIVGAGLVGTVLSVFLANAGFRVNVYDFRDDPRQTNLEIGRTINITLSKRGFRALNMIGAEEIVRKSCVPAYGRLVHAVDGELTYQPYGSNTETVLYPIRRQELLQVLVDFAAQHKGINFHFNEKCLEIDFPTTTLKFQNTHTGKVQNAQATRIFGADGAYSTVRQKMLRQTRVNYSQTYLEHGYREFLVPAHIAAGQRLYRDAIHVWPRDDFMLLGFPNSDGSFALTLLLPFTGEISYETITTLADYACLFETYFPDVMPLVRTNLAPSLLHPVGNLVMTKCYPWIYQDKVALIGDACHTIYPFYAQGVNAGFEDCCVLSELIEYHRGQWDAIFQGYQTQRKPNTDAIAELTTHHFTVLSKLVGDPEFNLREKIEKKLESLFPMYPSLYHNVAFTTMPYLEAQRYEHQHRYIVDKLMAVEGIAQRLDEPTIDQFLRYFVEGQRQNGSDYAPLGNGALQR